MTRRTRYFAAIFATLTIFFTQLAVAAYACPMLAGAAMATAEGPADCGGLAMDPVEPLLCQAHCDRGDQSLDKPSFLVPDQPLVEGLRTEWKPIREGLNGSGRWNRFLLVAAPASALSPLQGRLRV
jgi:hypothetical protein